jgi:cell wall-associated NlpC family hydrolase
MLFQISKHGKTVKINKVINSWAYITFENNNGWVRNALLNYSNTQTSQTTEETTTSKTEATTPKTEETTTTAYEAKKGYISATVSANVRETASTSAKILTTLTRNTGVTIVGEDGEFYKITYSNYTGYISKALVSDKQVAVTSRGDITTRETSTKTTESTATATVQTNESSSKGEELANFAQQFIGTSYVYGGTTPSGFDCSGFVYYVCKSCGYSLSRDCQVQANSGIAVSKSELQPGDLVFFNNPSSGSIGHVGMYIGGGRFVHAANPSKGVITTTLTSGYYSNNYNSARRIAY